ncbi:unnamed protein product [Mytilus coruscus]|uniref:RNA-directed DNA polymerase n=1 Tax=Mytilus coruscus TaxID=42192 RepID=A0A6J8BL68_MYTCO|nr:unnamed protein product [Mytilus coruscus]
MPLKHSNFRDNGIFILNGRVDKDANCGKKTCKNASLIDYAIASPELFSYISEFEVFDFNPLFSDVHCRLHVLFDNCSNDVYNLNCNKQTQISTVRWVPGKVNQYIACVENYNEVIADLINEVERLDVKKPDFQTDLDNIVDKINSVFIDSAAETFGQTRKRCSSANRVEQPWFNSACNAKRKSSHAAKKKYNCIKNEEMRLCLRQASADYKKELDKAYKDYEFRTENIIRETTSNNPNKLWKLLNDFGSHSSNNKANIHIDVLYKYFEDINKNTDYENDNVNLDFTAVSDNSMFDDIINGYISSEEILEDLKEKLRDRIVCGLKNPNIQKRLLSEKDLTYDKAVDIGVAMETASKDAIELQAKHRTEGVNKMSARKSKFQPQQNKGNSRCYRCNNAGHSPFDCKFKNTICHNCNKTGHIKKACMSKSKKPQPRKFDNKKSVHAIEEDSDSDNCTASLETYEMNNIKSSKDVMWVTPTVEGVTLKMELYTGSAVSVISQADFSKRLGESIKPLGCANVKVHYKGEAHVLPLYVVPKGGSPLFGREWLKHIKLDWNEIKEVHGIDQKENRGIEAELDRLEKEGTLNKVQHSEWATPIVPVLKKNGNVRISGEFKVTLNPMLKVDQYPLPKIDDIFANLNGGIQYTKMDLKQAYLQLEVDEDCKDLLTINTHRGLYRYNRMALGIASAPAIWQRTIEQILSGIPGTQCLLDDMIITGSTDEEHLNNLESVLKRLNQYGLKANIDKCEFFKDSATFCGHVIDKHGLHKTPDKIKAIKNAPAPENVSQLKSILGLINYYAKFLPDLSATLSPLHNLLRKDTTWKWTKECQEVKDLITSDMILTHFNPELPVTLACDASPYGLGAVISHRYPNGSDRPIAFASRSLAPAEKNYSQIDKEALGIIWGIKKFHSYLYGRKFKLITDHQPLIYIFNPQKGVSVTASARLQRYSLFLSGYEYEIEFRGTAKHANADSLSRLPLKSTEVDTSLKMVESFHIAQMEVIPVSNKQVQQETRNDRVLGLITTFTQDGWHTIHKDGEYAPYYSRRNELTVHQGCLMWGVRVIIPSKLRSQVLGQIHEGHLGVVKMKTLARSFVWWPGIDQDIEKLAKACN